MSPRAPRGRALLSVVLAASLLRVGGQGRSEPRPLSAGDLREAAAQVAEQVKGSLGRLAEEPAVGSMLKAFSHVLDVLSVGLASGLNVASHHLSHLLQAAGLHVSVPLGSITPEGVVFVLRWLLLALIGYWLASAAFNLLASTLRRALWILKGGVALGAFGLILSDRGAETETTAVRLAVLVLVCVLLGVSPLPRGTVVDRTAHLEEQLKVLDRRLREMERWRTTEE